MDRWNISNDKPTHQYGIIRELAVQRSTMNAYALSPGRHQAGGIGLETLKDDNCCKEVVRQIASLESLVHNVSGEFDARSVHIVNSQGDQPPADEISSVTAAGSLASNQVLSKTCITSVRQNWRWVYQVMQCAEVHLRNAAAYQMFFLELEEATKLMDALSSMHLNSNNNVGSGDVAGIMEYIRNAVAVFSQWQAKVEYLFDLAKKVVPVPDRVKGTKEIKVVTALTDFSSGDIEFVEGETLYLLDSSDVKKWKVRNTQGSEGEVPAVLLLLPAPFTPALEAAITLRLQLMSLWTNCLKRMGFRLIAFMSLIFKDLTEEEVDFFHSLSETDKCELLRVLFYIESELNRYWKGYGDFEELQEKLHHLQLILLTDDETKTQASSSHSATFVSYVSQIKSLEDLMKVYMEFWWSWEAFVSVTMLMKQPNYMLFCDKWEQLRFTKTTQIARFWDSEQWGKDSGETKTDLTKSRTSICMAEPPRPARQTSLEVTVEEKREESSTDVMTSDFEEDLDTYVIKSVIDPRNNQKVLSIQEAIVEGIIDQIHNTYVNPTTRTSKPIKDAMSDGDVIIEIIDSKKIREEHKSYGLITLKVTRESHPYTVTSVMDPQTKEALTVDEATQRNILDLGEGVYRTGSGAKLQLHDAIKAGHVRVEHHDVTKDPKPEVVEKTYAVHGVVDLKRKEKLSFAAAVRAGLLDKDTGVYVNNITGAKVPVYDAILRGFIKARVVADPSKLPLDPENKIVVNRFKKAEKKVWAELKVINAFKLAHK